MHVLVTGGRGFVAGAVARAALARRHEVVAPGRDTLDVTDPVAVRAVLAHHRPHAVVHTAYREHGPDLEAVTVGGTDVVAAACAAADVPLVHLSSDLVFPGREAPYAEHDERRPLTRYGRAKAAAEDAVSAAGGRACIVRTSLVLAGPGAPPGRHERLVLDVLDGRSPVRFFVDEVRRPVLVDVLARAVVALAEAADPPPVVHVAGPVAQSRLDLAVQVAGWSGRAHEPLPSASLAEVAASLPEPRPGRVVLDCTLATALGLLAQG